MRGATVSAYVLIVRHETTDPSGIAKYAELAQHAPNDKLQVLASKACEFKVLEGGQSAEAVVVLQFPTMNDALDWYNSDAYQKARPHGPRSGRSEEHTSEIPSLMRIAYPVFRLKKINKIPSAPV